MIFLLITRKNFAHGFFRIFSREINLHEMQNFSCNCAGILRHSDMAKKKPAKKKAVKAGKKKK
jgi:hypothetical protein